MREEGKRKAKFSPSNAEEVHAQGFQLDKDVIDGAVSVGGDEDPFASPHEFPNSKRDRRCLGGSQGIK
eukprot:768590-Hanusia_phi.AAC.22